MTGVDRPPNVRMRVTLVYEYETNPADYETDNPRLMAAADIEQDPTIVLDSDWAIQAASFVATGGS